MDSTHDFERGDLIKVRRKNIYYHWAIYVGFDTHGKENLVHMTRATNEGEDVALADDDGIVAFADEKQYKEALDEDLDQPEEEEETPAITCQVKKEPFTYNSGENDKWVKDNSLDDKFKPRAADEIIALAMHWTSLTAWSYTLLYFNCEHFAHLCRNGQLVSCQINDRTFVYKEHKAFAKLKSKVPYAVFLQIQANLAPPVSQGALQ